MIMVLVNGYGSTANVNDLNYGVYLNAVLEFVRARVGPDNPAVVCLAGGNTDSLELTEADSMFLWFRRRLGTFPEQVRFVSFADTLTARDNVEQFRAEVDTDTTSDLFIFCEFSRRFTLRYFAWEFFDRPVRVIGVKFDRRSLRWHNRLHQLCLNLPLEVLAHYNIPFCERLRLWIRRRHMNRMRALKHTKTKA